MDRYARTLIVVTAMIGGASLGQTAVGCGSTPDVVFPGGGGGRADAGTDQSSTGQGGKGGQAGTGGAGACHDVAGYDPVAAGLPSCCDTGAAHCVPTNEVQPQLAYAFGDCAAKGGGAGLCVPDKQIAVGSSFAAKECPSLGGAAGVCLSTCVKAVYSDPNVGLLMHGICDMDELCVPCVNPITGKPTGACGIKTCGSDGGSGGTGGGDAGPMCPHEGPPVLDPAMFEACSPACGGAHCVPANGVPPAEQAQLATCTTMGGAGFCAPDPFIAAGGNLIAPSCVSGAGAEGRCLSDCLPAVAAQLAVLPQATCAASERCVPCFDPTTHAPTGACTISCDPGPKDPPVMITCPWTGPPVVDPAGLPACSPACGGAHCLPAAFVPAAQQAQLATCPGGFCLPDPLITTAGNFVPKTCAAIAGTTAEGRCQSTCLPAVSAQAANLEQDTCAGGQLCVPCYDPYTGAATGACSSAPCDMPKSPAFTFKTCCPFQGMNQGTCIPKVKVPPAEQGSLQQLGCDPSFLCVPNEYLPTATMPVPGCNAGLLGKGACVSKCTTAPQIFGQGTCSGNHMCVPCNAANPPPPGCGP
ncbi:MAG: hypothetical protein ABJE95_27315 [Byssovorax sp.]